MFGRLCLKEVAKDMVVPKPVEEEKSSHKASVSSQVFVVNSSSMCQDSQGTIQFEAGRSVVTASYCWKLCWQDCIKKVANTPGLRPDHLDPRLEVLHLLRSVVCDLEWLQFVRSGTK